MDEKVRIRMYGIDLLAKGDDMYYRMLKKMRDIEQKYDRVLGTLPADQQDIICDFVSLCEEMSLRKLEIACSYMEFPD